MLPHNVKIVETPVYSDGNRRCIGSELCITIRRPLDSVLAVQDIAHAISACSTNCEVNTQR